MKNPDLVKGILEPYSNSFHLWGAKGQLFETGNAMPAVGMATSYSVQLPSSDPDAKPVFLQVQEGRLTNIMALQPLMERNVFDPKGRYLGRGGSPLEPLVENPPEPVDIVTAVRGMAAPLPAQEAPPEPVTIQGGAPQSSGGTVTISAGDAAPPKSIGQLMTELKSLTDQLPEPDPREHRFHLRDDFEVVLHLPEDLTKHEALRLAKFIGVLPIEEPADTF